MKYWPHFITVNRFGYWRKNWNHQRPGFLLTVVWFSRFFLLLFITRVIDYYFYLFKIVRYYVYVLEKRSHMADSTFWGSEILTKVYKSNLFEIFNVSCSEDLLFVDSDTHPRFINYKEYLFMYEYTYNLKKKGFLPQVYMCGK